MSQAREITERLARSGQTAPIRGFTRLDAREQVAHRERVVRRVVDIEDAQHQLAELIESAAGGDEIVIARGGVPRARLVPIRDDARKRIPGRGRGRFRMREGFDDELPPDLFGEP